MALQVVSRAPRPEPRHPRPMKFQNIKLILGREIRDQLRDRRTLFMIAVLPLLLYPLLGMSFLQVSQFLKEHPTRVLVVGGGELAKETGSPRLFDAEGHRFDAGLFQREGESSLLELTFADDAELLRGKRGEAPSAEELATAARARMREQQYDAVIYFPREFAKELSAFRTDLKSRHTTHDAEAPVATEPDGGVTAEQTAKAEKPRIPSPVIFNNTSREASQIARSRIESVLYNWTTKVGEQNLIDSDVPKIAARPFSLESSDVAESGRRDAVMWAKILPFVLMIWALTGAFYPAVDLCAGEKERGTLETLLCSPAERSEIVVGKLLTVMGFSMATAVLNLASMGITGGIVLASQPQLGNALRLGMPPVESLFWLALALPAVSAFFGGLAVALAAFARSTKEGQYYLMPLILISMPLMVLPMKPTMELSLGTALIPVTGLMLLLRELLMANYAVAATCALPVIAVTLTGCYLAVRWAIDQFNSESVLFRESERLDLGLWLKHLRADRMATPTAAMGIACGVLILLIRFFTGIVLPMPTTTEGVMVMQAVTLIAFVAAPALFMTVVLTRSPRKTLSLYWPRWQAIPAVILLAVSVHPLAMLLHQILASLYPVDAKSLEAVMAPFAAISFGWMIVILALLPAICEEITFRGFVLSGLRETGHPWRAILVSSVFFGLAHAFLIQQTISAMIFGVLLGYLAVRSGSLLCTILFHFIHNSLMFGIGTFGKEAVTHEWTHWFVNHGVNGEFTYRPVVTIFAAIGAVAAIWWFRRATPQTTAAMPASEEQSVALPPETAAVTETIFERERVAT
jgi:sodium transport system permease protein